MAWWAAIPAAMSMMQGQGGGGGDAGGGGGWQFQGVGNRMAGLASGLFNLFGAKNPSDAANPFLQQMEGSAGNYLNPYIQAGQRAGNLWGNENMANVADPTRIMNNIGSTFESSPGYGFMYDESMRAANNAAAAGGMAGSPAAMQRAQEVGQGLARQDYYNYMDRGLGQYGNAMGGLSHQNDIGFGAAGQMAQIAAMMKQLQAMNAYEGANTSNQQKGGAIGSITKSLF